MKIIVVDDESNALSTFLLNIVDENYIEYKMFKSNPVAAIDYVKDNQVHAAFLDVNMPEINGIELAGKLVDVNPKIRIVFISGYIQNEREIKAKLKCNLAGMCYKPYDAEKLLNIINRISVEIGDGRDILLRTFGAFELCVDNKPVKFTSAKSKELLAVLTHKNGAHLSMGEAIAFLWTDKNTELAKILYRDAVWRLRQTLKQYSLGSLVNFSRAQQAIVKDNVRCDYWDYLAQKNIEAYHGVYMPNYDWSVETQVALEDLHKKDAEK